MDQRRWTRRTIVTLPLFALAAPLAAQRVAEVQVSPPTVTLSVGQEGGVFATAYDANGNVLVGQTFRWTSTNPNAVRIVVDPTSSDVATLVAVAQGIARIEARIGSQAGTAAVQVVGAGGVPEGPGGRPAGSGPATVLRIEPGNILMLPAESRQLIPVFLKDDGSVAAPTTVTWRSLNETVATVSVDGLVVAISQGQGIIEASTNTGLVARSPVQVTAARFAFTTPVLSLSPGTETTIQVGVPSQGDRPLPNNGLAWRSSDESVVRVTPLGVAHAVSAGRATITASGFLQEQTLPVTVHRSVSAMTALPRSDRGPIPTPLGGSVQFRVQPLAADSTPVPEAPLVWTVRDTAVASFDAPTQVLRGKTIGETELRVRVPGPDSLAASWQIQVIAGGLLARPRRVGIGVGDTVAVSVEFTDQAGSPIGAASGVTWTTSDSAVVQVTGQGTVTGTGAGRARVVAATPWDAADTVDVFVQGALLVASTRDGAPNIYAIDPAVPTEARQVTTDPAAEVAASFAPNGSRIAYVTNRDGNLELYVANADGSEPLRLTETDAAEDGPVWMPDGTHIVYASQARGGKAQVWIVGIDGTGARALTSGDATDFEPAVSPDGGTIAFTSTRDGNYEIYVMNADGSAVRRVTDTPAKESHPAWFPDGQLGYVSEETKGTTISGSVMRVALPSGAATPVTPAGMAVTDFAIAPDGQRLAVEVSAFNAAGGISRRIVLLVAGSTQAPVEIPVRQGEQQSGPAFRPRRTP